MPWTRSGQYGSRCSGRRCAATGWSGGSAWMMPPRCSVATAPRSAGSRRGCGGSALHDLRDLLAEYGVSEGERAGLMALAGPRGLGGWDAYADVLPRAAREYLWLEAAASHVFVYEGQRVPALLRAEGYARAIAEHDPLVPAGTAGRVAEVLAARQRAVLGAEQPELVMVIGEAALRQQVGGAKVMREQFARLAALSADSDRVTILVLPFASGAHAGPAAGR